MRSFADNSQERQSRAIANAPGEQSRKGTYMVDNRPEMAVQRKMAEVARKYGEQKALQRKQMFTRKEAVQKKGPEDEDELQFKAIGAVQCKGPEDEDELQFKSKEAVQKKGPEDEDELQFKAKDAVQLKGPEDEDELQFKAKDAVQLKGPEDEDELQFKAEEPVQKQENKTGLPDDLKAGVENLSGMAMDDVRVHYNSGKPAQLNAYAYTQGSEIHVAPGQEKHLPHEAWHVVQQKQGRVQPTMQMAGGVAVNDDKGLEREADGMGVKVEHESHIGSPQQKVHGQLQMTEVGKTENYNFVTQVVQRADTDDEMSESDSESSQSESDDSDYEEMDDDAHQGYMSPSVYLDLYGGSDHTNLENHVWASKIIGRVALWWKNPNEQFRIRLTGQRNTDIAAVGGDDPGYTWHHCSDYIGGFCTMQQVPTVQHSSWGHSGGAWMAGYNTAD